VRRAVYGSSCPWGGQSWARCHERVVMGRVLKGQIAMGRVVQELLYNSRRHAGNHPSFPLSGNFFSQIFLLHSANENICRNMAKCTQWVFFFLFVHFSEHSHNCQACLEGLQYSMTTSLRDAIPSDQTVSKSLF
jgi:hypothetical protein